MGGNVLQLLESRQKLRHEHAGVVAGNVLAIVGVRTAVGHEHAGARLEKG